MIGKSCESAKQDGLPTEARGNSHRPPSLRYGAAAFTRYASEC
jgi:hypothetical protein